MTVDIYYYVDKSTKQKLFDYSKFCDVEYKKILKHVITRWLSVGTIINRKLHGSDKLKSYLLSFPPEKKLFAVRPFKKNYRKLNHKNYLLFHHAVLLRFTTVNQFLQREEQLYTSVVVAFLVFRSSVFKSKFVKI